MIKALLTFLMVIGSTTTSIQHSHAQGRTAHTHGFGFGLDSTVAIEPGEPIRHSHLVLLGLEFYAGENAPTEPRPEAPGEARAHIGLEGEADDGESLKLKDPHDGSQFVLVGRIEAKDAPPHPKLRSVGTGLCDRARGERSGVNNC